jgi:hypothetical protein
VPAETSLFLCVVDEYIGKKKVLRKKEEKIVSRIVNKKK